MDELLATDYVFSTTHRDKGEKLDGRKFYGLKTTERIEKRHRKSNQQI